MMGTASEPTCLVYTIERGNAALNRDTVLALWRDNLKQDSNGKNKFDWFYPATAPGGGSLFTAADEDV